MIYFIQQDQTNLVKIGFSHNIKRRLATLQTASAYSLRLLGYCVGDTQKERAIHDELALSRVAGEWFNYTDQVYDAIRKYCHTHEAELSNTIFQYKNLVDAILHHFGGMIRSEANDAVRKRLDDINVYCDKCMSLYCDWDNNTNQWLCSHCAGLM